jgi:hypothetical protein
MTLKHPKDDQAILSLEDFGHALIRIERGEDALMFQFDNWATFNRACSQWEWVNNINRTITLITNMGGDRVPVLVHGVQRDSPNLSVLLLTFNTSWAFVAQDLELDIRYYDSEIDNVELAGFADDDKYRTANNDISLNQNLFNFSRSNARTAGLDLTADATLELKGSLLFGLHWRFHRSKLHSNVSIQPKGLNVLLSMVLAANGRLGRPLDFEMSPIDIPITPLNIAKIGSMGPFFRAGVNFAAEALEGTATASLGLKATVPDTASILVEHDNVQQQDWTPLLDPMDFQFSAELSGSIKAWVEMSFGIRAENLELYVGLVGLEVRKLMC